MDVFVARQAIFDRARQLYGYELLFRSDGDHNEFDGTESGSATTQVIANSLLSIGLENIVCGKKAFVNFDRMLLMSGLHSMIPREDLVLEILESVEPDLEFLAACRELYEQGYTIALDDFVRHPRLEPLTEIAKVIKVDIQATAKDEQRRLLRIYQPRGIAMLAEKVETREEFDWAQLAGYDFFQGYFFTKPVVVRGQQIPAAKLTCLHLLREMQQTDLDFKRLQTLISEDVSLSFKLLRYVNSALFHFRRSVAIHSIDRALAALGESSIRCWVALAALPALAKNKPGELVTHSLVRARFCERLAQLSGVQEHHLGFLMGLFSLLDALIDLPLDEALLQAGVAPAISGALLGTAREEDAFRNVYRLVCRYEIGDWDAVKDLAEKLKIKTSVIGEAYAESTLWAQQALHATTRKANSRRRVRHACDEALRIWWQDHAGQERIANARLVNVSAVGLQLLLAEQLPLSTGVTCNDPKLGISGTGLVRYCNFSNGTYLVGVEFSSGTGWREPFVVTPQRISERQTIRP
jgi:c-di-GMP-related signal transduction protein